MYRHLIEPEQLANKLEDPEWVVVDCRFDLKEPEGCRHAYHAQHIPGARYAHLDNDLAGPKHNSSGRHPLPDPKRLTQTLGDWGIDGKKQVVVYDDVRGAIAARLWWLLRWLGHDQVAVLNGGLKAWQVAGLPLTAKLPGVTPVRFEPRFNESTWVDVPFIEAGLGKGVYRLIDARSSARFRGEMEPFDPVAGHVPGALSRPFECNLGPDGKFLPANQLHAEFQKLIQVSDGFQAVHMCGSGVTACHNLLAMEYAGIASSRLYVGSWSEWVTDRSRPVATGTE
jgi:thiosulfate/3-mercaptopyruvate sulfurtransferase